MADKPPSRKMWPTIWRGIVAERVVVVSQVQLFPLPPGRSLPFASRDEITVGHVHDAGSKRISLSQIC